MTRSTWDDTADELVSRLWAEGVSASQISVALDRMGYSFSRCAVMGRVHRAKYRTPAIPFQQRERKVRVRQAAPKPPKPVRVPFIRPTLPPPAPEAASTAFGKTVGLLELAEHHCRWIINDPSDGALYCAAGKLAGAPYCVGHCAVAYRRHSEPEARAA